MSSSSEPPGESSFPSSLTPSALRTNSAAAAVTTQAWVSDPASSEANGSNQHLYGHARRAVVWAMVLNILIASIKLAVAMLLTRSAALFSEGLHSLADALNSLTLLFGITSGNRSPDRTHPFGYGLETNFWALLASFMLFLSAGWAVWTGFQRLMLPMPIESIGWAVSILAVSLILEVFAVRVASRAVLAEVGYVESEVGKMGLVKLFSKAWGHVHQVLSPTTRFVFYEDCIAFLGALIAMLVIVGTDVSLKAQWLDPGYAHWPDAIGSMLIGVLLLILAVNLFRYNRGFLTGASAPAKVEEKIELLALGVHGVSRVFDLKTIDQGLSGLIVHMKVEVEPDTPVKDVDDLTERIKTRIQDRIRTVQQVFIEVLADESEDAWKDKFEQLIAQGRQEGILKPREEIILKNVYDFTESEVFDVMIPRTDVLCVEVDTPLPEVADILLESGRSRLPVYEKQIDNIVGLIQARDVFEHIKNQDLTTTSLRELLREIDIYPETKPVSDLLEDFKRKKIQMAAVADEYGGFAGIVTIADLMEEIVGEIFEESNPEEETLQLLDARHVLLSGKLEIEDLNERFGLSLPCDEFKTIGGFVFGQLGHEPEAGNTTTFEDLDFEVTETDGPRIVMIKLTLPEEFRLPPTELPPPPAEASGQDSSSSAN